ncbi:16S rRNA (uracil(1498)-N(3))-methyltransferase [Reinekea sp.]|jgi:16S rRNA (uracil1498-N3)-methyltransferase|uniref:16S rRNA (uracil(1498)-N(3))-methyltransferase n=1 Tax=Reinekea sp. TaxID=1970455 RepID=UPI002A8254AE|nr:16S rRNA (uracil(1498)-N(3))-methyltransferase [Reinekea sp.]
MRTIRAWLPEAESLNQIVPLPAAVFQHLVKVLRLDNGAQIEVFNGQGLRFNGSLIDVGKKSAYLLLSEQLVATAESPLISHLGLVMSKGDRFDYAVQKATELGVTSLTPLTSERCDLRLARDRYEKKLHHWHGIMTSACEQSYRDTLPILQPIQSLNDWAVAQDSALKLVFHTAAQQPNWQAERPASVSFLVGPEGGLSEPELAFAQQQGFTRWQLGPRILRTETAPVVILSLLQARWGDF